MAEVSEYLKSILVRLTPEQLRAFESLKRTEYRSAAEKCLRVLCAIDEIMAHSREPVRDWEQISLALGLPSCRYRELTEAKISQRFGISEMAVSKQITKILRLAELKPNGRGFNGVNVRL